MSFFLICKSNLESLHSWSFPLLVHSEYLGIIKEVFKFKFHFIHVENQGLYQAQRIRILHYPLEVKHKLWRVSRSSPRITLLCILQFKGNNYLEFSVFCS